MSDFSLRVEHLSKAYDLKGTALMGSLREFAPKLLEGLKSKQTSNFLWALSDLCFEVKQGETLALIGRNGAGKSTLLKILSRVTDPTSGRALVRGKVGSLLEVGVGFHPELSGRENVFLSGAILGMKQESIKKRFDEIVTFAGLEKFIDVPVKRYSSGMFVRLGFAVAANLDQDILIVDEVLAVGDAPFQSRCLEKLTELRHEGRTVLFVSHNAGSVINLCQTALYLKDGQLQSFGKTDEVVAQYLQDSSIQSNVNLQRMRDMTDRHEGRRGSLVRFEEVKLCSAEGMSIAYGDPLCYEVEISSRIDSEELGLRLTFVDGLGKVAGSTFLKETLTFTPGELRRFRIVINNLNLTVGTYSVYFVLSQGVGTNVSSLSCVDEIQFVPAFEVVDSPEAPRAWSAKMGPCVFEKTSLTEISIMDAETIA